MANVSTISQKLLINAVNAYFIGGDAEFVGTYVVHFVASGFTGSVTVKARALTVPEAAADSVTPVAWYYRTAAGVIATAAITGSALITIPSGGVELVLDCTSFSAGTLTAYISRIKGIEN